MACTMSGVDRQNRMKYGGSKRLRMRKLSRYFPGSRSKAEKLFRQRYPGFVDRTGFGYKRIPRVAVVVERKQLSLFD